MHTSLKANCAELKLTRSCLLTTSTWAARTENLWAVWYRITWWQEWAYLCADGKNSLFLRWGLVWNNFGATVYRKWILYMHDEVCSQFAFSKSGRFLFILLIFGRLGESWICFLPGLFGWTFFQKSGTANNSVVADRSFNVSIERWILYHWAIASPKFICVTKPLMVPPRVAFVCLTVSNKQF